MGQTDLAVRLLAGRFLEALLPALLPGRRVEFLGLVQSERQLIERLTDRVARVRLDGCESVLHFEFQVRPEKHLDERVLLYHALVRHDHAPLPVLTLLVYLMPTAPRGGVPRGILRRPDDSQLDFRYHVFCPWEQQIGLEVVEHQPALAPLAVLTPGIREADLPHLRATLERAALPHVDRADLSYLTYVLGGRRFPRDLLDSLLRSELMEDSSTYQGILADGREQGRVSGLAKGIVTLAEVRLGAPPDGLDGRLLAMTAPELESLLSTLVRLSDLDAFEAALPQAPRARRRTAARRPPGGGPRRRPR